MVMAAMVEATREERAARMVGRRSQGCAEGSMEVGPEAAMGVVARTAVVTTVGGGKVLDSVGAVMVAVAKVAGKAERKAVELVGM